LINLFSHWSLVIGHWAEEAEAKNSSPHLPISPSPHTSLREAAPTAPLSTSLPIFPSPHLPLPHSPVCQSAMVVF